MINKDEISTRLRKGDWYSFSATCPIRWRVTGVFGDNSYAKQFHDLRSDKRGVVHSPYDVTFHRLVKMFEEGRLCFV